MNAAPPRATGADSGPEPAEMPEEKARSKGHCRANGTLETILLVEDDDLVRSVFRRILHSCGYFVLEAEDGPDALVLAREFTPPIHLLVADLNLPQVGGLEVARRMEGLHPESKVLLVSGSLEELGMDSEEEALPFPLLLKPFTADTFLEQVRAILGRG